MCLEFLLLRMFYQEFLIFIIFYGMCDIVDDLCISLDYLA